MPKLSFAHPLADSAAAVAIVATALSARAGSHRAPPFASVCFPHTRSRPPSPAPAAPWPPLARGSASVNGTARVTLPVRQVLSFEPFAFFLLSPPPLHTELPDVVSVLVRRVPRKSRWPGNMFCIGPINSGRV